jgi:hypothetical protein
VTERVAPHVTDVSARARTLLNLHTAPEILVLANVWDVVSARVVAATPGAKALATASHSIASTFGYEDGENIPLGLHLDMVGRIVAAVELPVTMDFEAGYGDAGTTARRAIDVGVVGGNLEDQMKPLDEAVAAVEAVLAAARQAGIDDFVLNARTDAALRMGDSPPGQGHRRGGAAWPRFSGGRGAGGFRAASGRPGRDPHCGRRAWPAKALGDERAGSVVADPRVAGPRGGTRVHRPVHPAGRIDRVAGGRG